MKLVLDIPDNKANDFIATMKSLGYVSWKSPELVPQAQQDEVAHRLEMIENGTMKVRSWNAFEAELKKRNGI